MYHTDVFSLSGYRSVFVATRRRSSQATGPLVVVIDDLLLLKRYQPDCRNVNDEYPKPLKKE